MKRKLVLENGMEFIGEGFGSDQFTVGEVVFTTGMTGYQETMSDPSFHKQIIVFTYPLIGNYGINPSDFESLNPFVGGVVVHEFAHTESHWQSQMNIDYFLKKQNIPGLSGIDTRALVKMIRTKGSMKGKFCDLSEDTAQVAQKLQNTILEHHVPEVSTPRAYSSPGEGYRIVLIDYGMKKSILKELCLRKCDVVVVPYNTNARSILELNPDGIMLSNGPGDPQELNESIEIIKQISGKVPIFGICLGHQLFAIAHGAKTYKMLFGHRGANHPVKELKTNRVHITSQNHGYAVEEDSLKNTPLEITHRALNDGTIEGLCHKENYAFTVQYHPESSPGPNDNEYLFNQFMNLIRDFKNTH
ncbi:carbamoyl phosphate synthase small subunit [Apibacter muscae]|uniref:Carbamoyl phosphate synthase small chain n=1 Tax=Apibacter muscae TaxID=2509004 RepID=A0A563DK42_9FLAO|nr:carbamoyl phosphate synthase small subunit [Apibacter muscae]TWP25218.1 carbamoyl phosphate synthase small subunit [Apibacter muscae]TWP30575.1 carbamoyl phosphate synthase small subunit [Apibacter muscae]